MISAATAQRADRPVVVALPRHRRTASSSGRSRPAPTTSIALPQSPGQLGVRAREGARAAARRGSTSAEGAMITVLGPEGRHRQDASRRPTSRSRSRWRAVAGDRRPRPAVRRRRARARPRADRDDLRPRRLGRLARRRQDRRLPRPAPVRARGRCSRRCGRTRRPRSGPSFLREVFEILRSRYDFVIVDTPPAFTPEVIAAVDASSHLCMVGMLDALSLKDTKIGLETLAQMGYDPRAITLVLNRADSSVGITQRDVEQLLGRAPDVLVGSDRAIPRALTDGQPIVGGRAEVEGGAVVRRPRRAVSARRRRRLPARPRRERATDGGGCCCGRRADDGAARADRELADRRQRASTANGNGTTIPSPS